MRGWYIQFTKCMHNMKISLIMMTLIADRIACTVLLQWKACFLYDLLNRAMLVRDQDQQCNLQEQPHVTEQ